MCETRQENRNKWNFVRVCDFARAQSSFEMPPPQTYVSLIATRFKVSLRCTGYFFWRSAFFRAAMSFSSTSSDTSGTSAAYFSMMFAAWRMPQPIVMAISFKEHPARRSAVAAVPRKS